MADAVGVKLSAPVQIRAAGIRSSVDTAEQAIEMIDKDLPTELAQLPRWTFARALLVEAVRSKKSRDIKAATRQLQQALRNEKWTAAAS
jgi:uncharacterized protein YfaQ (DUF2300 family)